MPRRSNNKKKGGKKKTAEYYLKNKIELLKLGLEGSKNNRSDPFGQDFLLRTIAEVALKTPDVFLSSSTEASLDDGIDLLTEVPLAVLMALKSHPQNKEIRHFGFLSISALFATACCKNLIKFQGHQTLLSVMQEPYFYNEKGFQIAFLTTLQILADDHPAIFEDSVFRSKVPPTLVLLFEAAKEAAYAKKDDDLQKKIYETLLSLLLTGCEELIRSFFGIHDNFFQYMILAELQNIFQPCDSAWTEMRNSKGMICYRGPNKECGDEYPDGVFQGTREARQVLFEVSCTEVPRTMTAWKEDIHIQNSGWESLRSMGIYQTDDSLCLLCISLSVSMVELNKWAIAATKENNIQSVNFPTGCSRFLEVFNGVFSYSMDYIKPSDGLYARICEEAIKLLSNLMLLAQSNNEDAKVWLTTQGGASFLLALMAEDPGDQEMRQYVAKIFGFLTTSHNPKILEAISELDGVDVLLDAIEKYPKDETIFHYGGSAALRVREYEDAKNGFIWKNICNT